MKIISRKIRECEHTDGTPITALEIKYTHKKYNGTVFIKDYNPDLDSEYDKEIRKSVKELYEKEIAK